jgi:hypothetical protein
MTEALSLSLPRLFGNQKKIGDHIWNSAITQGHPGGRFFVLRCGRRYGKGVLTKHLLTQGMLAGHPVAWISPTYKMLSPVWREFREELASVTRDKSEQEHRLELITGGSIDFWSTESIESMRGRRYWMIGDDEVAMDEDIVDHFNGIIRPTLVDYEGLVLFPSTPRGRNGFYTMHSWCLDESEKEWQEFHRTTFDNPYLNPEEIMKLKYTMSEKWYRQEILAEFIENEGSVFRNLDATLNAPSSMPDEHKDHIIVAGIDWGRDNDYTVLSIGCAQCRREIFIDRFNTIDYEFQKARTSTVLTNWGTGYATFELNSIGGPMFDSMVRHLTGRCALEGFNTTFKSKGPLIEGLSLELEKGSIQLLPYPVGRSELEAYEAKRHDSGYISYSAPQGLHDDTVVARSLMVRKMNQFSHHERRERGSRTNPLEALIYGKNNRHRNR